MYPIRIERTAEIEDRIPMTARADICVFFSLLLFSLFLIPPLSPSPFSFWVSPSLSRSLSVILPLAKILSCSFSLYSLFLSPSLLSLPHSPEFFVLDLLRNNTKSPTTHFGCWWMRSEWNPSSLVPRLLCYMKPDKAPAYRQPSSNASHRCLFLID